MENAGGIDIISELRRCGKICILRSSGTYLLLKSLTSPYNIIMFIENGDSFAIVNTKDAPDNLLLVLASNDTDGITLALELLKQKQLLIEDYIT